MISNKTCKVLYTASWIWLAVVLLASVMTEIPAQEQWMFNFSLAGAILCLLLSSTLKEYVQNDPFKIE